MPHKDPEQKREYNRQYRLANLERERLRKRTYMADVYPAEKAAQASAKWLERNPDKALQRAANSRVRTRKWAKENPDKVYANIGTRRARKCNACPPWVDRGLIDAIYVDAYQTTLKTGIPHEVDHIIPLAGKNVCGLHVPWNLQVIPASENRRKANKVLG